MYQPAIFFYGGQSFCRFPCNRILKVITKRYKLQHTHWHSDTHTHTKKESKVKPKNKNNNKAKQPLAAVPFFGLPKIQHTLWPSFTTFGKMKLATHKVSKSVTWCFSNFYAQSAIMVISGWFTWCSPQVFSLWTVSVKTEPFSLHCPHFLWPELKCGLCEHHRKCQNNHQHDCGHPRKEEEEERRPVNDWNYKFSRGGDHGLPQFYRLGTELISQFHWGLHFALTMAAK